ncbi:MAG: hypothetical protein K2P78_14405, partial [Gemmataceae bacterium]|nr:hypothetical protein [Gemmataceae bacterium]
TADLTVLLPADLPADAYDLAVQADLLTSQAPVPANNQPDPARTIRAEKPVELAAKASTADLTVLLPADLPADAYDLAVQADLLSADKQRVLAAAFTPVRRLPVRLPIAVKLSSPAKVTLTIDPKSPPTAEIKGAVERLGGATGDVTVTLGGLPPGVQTTPVTVKSADTAFTVPVRVLPTTAPGTTKGLPLAATIAPDPKQPTVRVKSRDVELELVILPPK